MRASELVEWRATKVDQMRTGLAEIAAAPNEQIQRLRRDQFAAAYGDVDRSLTVWRMAELFYVATEMFYVAASAAESMPEFSLQPSDLPSEFGIMYTRNPDNAGFNEIALWAVRGGGVDVTIIGVEAYQKPDVLVLYRYRMEFGGSATIIESGKDTPNALYWLAVTRCSWLLMQQPLTSITEEHPDRAAVRRLQRKNFDLAPVRVIRLRRSSPSAPTDGTREYVHQWVVRGHWRKQWYASQNRHVPLWIHPYVKGPEDAPLLGGEKVYEWSR